MNARWSAELEVKSPTLFSMELLLVTRALISVHEAFLDVFFVCNITTRKCVLQIKRQIEPQGHFEGLQSQLINHSIRLTTH